MSDRLSLQHPGLSVTRRRGSARRSIAEQISLLALGIGVGLAGVSPAIADTQMVNTEEPTFALAALEAPAQASATATPDKTKATSAAKRLQTASNRQSESTDDKGRTVSKDGLVDGAAYIEADQITTLDDKTLIASGNVEMRHKGTVIRADQVSYNEGSGVVIADGNARAIGDDGAVTFAQRLTFNENMSTGSGEMVAALSADKTRVFARRFEQLNENTNRLEGVIYTPCELCAKDGVTPEPGWSIQATEVTQRKDQKLVYYKNALIKIKGVPVFYLPYMWTPDPDNDRVSGLMPPSINNSRRRGFSVELPYLWAISPYSEMIISPQINGNVNPFLNLEYNRRFYSGLFQFRVGGTEETYFDSRGDRFGESEFRGYVLADGRFRINDDWRWSFTAQHIWDPTGNRINADFFDRYNIEDAYPRTGDFRVSDRQLVNQFHVIRQTSNAWVSLSVADFQSMRVAQYVNLGNGTRLPLASNAAVFPVIAPMIDAQWTPRLKILGGQLTLSANAIGLKHKSFPGDGAAPAFYQQAGIVNSGFDTSRASAGIAWEGNIVMRNGIRFSPFVDVRHDYYSLTDLGNGVDEAEVNRTLSTAGVTISYPMIRRFSKFTVIVEPIAQIAVSPEYEFNDFLPTEDSQFIEFDTTNLFSTNRSPGFDLYETGTRLNLGVRTEFRFNNGVKLNTVLGRTLRDDPLQQFMRSVNGTGGTILYYDAYGLADKQSDWLIDSRLDLRAGVYAYSRLRLDSDELRVVQNDSGLSWVQGDTSLTLRYIRNDILRNPVIVNNQIVDIYGDNYENVQIYGRHFFTANWGVSARIDRDLIQDQWRRSTVSVIYREDCLWFEVVYQRNDTQISTINGKPQSSIFLRLNLATMGTQKNKFNDVR